MKNLRTAVLCACISLISICSFAQTANDIPINEPDRNKPKLFQHLPDYFPVNVDNLNMMLNSQTGNDVNVNLSAESTLPFIGKVISNASKYENSIYKTQGVLFGVSPLNTSKISF